MKTTLLLLVLFMSAVSSHADDGVLPLEKGIFVAEGTPCEEPASAYLLGYYGNTFAIGHDSCVFANVDQQGSVIQTDLVCTNVQSDSDERTSMRTQFTIEDRTHFVLTTALNSTPTRFVYCRANL